MKGWMYVPTNFILRWLWWPPLVREMQGCAVMLVILGFVTALCLLGGSPGDQAEFQIIASEPAVVEWTSSPSVC